MPTFVYRGLEHAAFPGSEHPDALVHVPDDPTQLDPEKVGLVVYLHGFENCIENAAAAPPGIFEPPEPAADLIGQLERSGRSAILLLPETRYRARSGDGGALHEPGGFLRLLGEVLGRLRDDHPALSALAADSFAHTMLIAHSGAFRTAAALAKSGGLPVHELCLLDSLYSAVEDYQHIADTLITALKNGEGPRRLVNLYRTGGTQGPSRTLAAYVKKALKKAELPERLLHDDISGRPLELRQLGHPLVVKRVTTEHSSMGLVYVGRLLATSQLPVAAGAPPAIVDDTPPG